MPMLTRRVLLAAGGQTPTGLGVMTAIVAAQSEALRDEMGWVIDGSPSETVCAQNNGIQQSALLLDIDPTHTVQLFPHCAPPA